MGYNSTVLVLNDRLSEIESNPEEFVKEMLNTIYGIGCSDKSGDFYPGQSTVMSCAHADTVTVLAVGGNCSTVLGRVYNGGIHHTEESQVGILEVLADIHGFRLVKKPQKKKNRSC